MHVHELGNVVDTESETSIAGYGEELGESSPIQKSEQCWHLLRNRNRHVWCLAASCLAKIGFSLHIPFISITYITHHQQKGGTG